MRLRWFCETPDNPQSPVKVTKPAKEKPRNLKNESYGGKWVMTV